MRDKLQFNLRELLVFTAAVPVWSLCARIVATIPGDTILAAMIAFAGIAFALYQPVRQYRLGWAIAVFGSPLLTVSILGLLGVIPK